MFLSGWKQFAVSGLTQVLTELWSHIVEDRFLWFRRPMF